MANLYFALVLFFCSAFSGDKMFRVFMGMGMVNVVFYLLRVGV